MLPEWILFHAGLMLTAWVLVLPAGVMIARFFKVTARQGYPRMLDNRMWFRTHVVMQYAGVICTTLGLLVAWSQVGSLNLSVPHAALGLSAVALGWHQIIWGVRRGSKGGPTDPAGLRGDHYDMTPRRWFFERVHRTSGYLALFTALAAALSGLRLVNAPPWIFGTLLLFPALFTAAFWLFSRQRWRVLNSYAAVWGPNTPQPVIRLTVFAPRTNQGTVVKRRPTSSRLKDLSVPYVRKSALLIPFPSAPGLVSPPLVSRKHTSVLATNVLRLMLVSILLLLAAWCSQAARSHWAASGGKQRRT